jgi:hypothetical protein
MDTFNVFHDYSLASECRAQLASEESRPTKRAVDEWESAPSQAESTPEHLPIDEADTTPALRN